MLQVTGWARRAREVHDGVDVTGHRELPRDVALDERESRVVAEGRKVCDTPGDEIVERDDLVAAREQVLDEMGAEEAGSAGYDDARHRSSLLVNRS